MDTIATRVRRALTASGMHQKDLARAVDMTPDALSRALNGNRGFAALELAELARVLDADLAYLITGEQDSTRLRLAARHTYDPVTGRRDVKGLDADQAVLSDVQLAYEQAGDAPVSELSCADVSSLRAALGPEFVRYFIIHLERVGVDVVRMAELSTAYGFRIGSRPVIAIPETGNWFRENWDLAHEAAHLCLGHECVLPGTSTAAAHEAAANAFAAELLLPEEHMRAVDWSVVTAEEVAAFLWDKGVSCLAVKNRLASLGLTPSPGIAELLESTTQRVLRRYWQSGMAGDPITARMSEAAQRSFPTWLKERHVELIAKGQVTKATFAWMLGVDADALEVEEHQLSVPHDPDELLGLLA